MSDGVRQLVLIALFAAARGLRAAGHGFGRRAQLRHDGALRGASSAQAWNILGGFGGQFSFGHALFFGTGAYIQTIAQLQGGINAWVALAARGGRRGGWSGSSSAR